MEQRFQRARGAAPGRKSGKAEVGDLEKLSEIKIAGIRAVKALFRLDPSRVLRLFYNEQRAIELGECLRTLALARKPYRKVFDDELEKVYGSPHHGGVVAITYPRPEQPLSIRDLSRLRSRGPIHFVLDGIANPHNLGAISRSLAFFGFKSLILTDDPRQAGFSDAAYRVAEGGLEMLDLYRVAGFQQFAERARQEFKITGTVLSPRAKSLSALKEDPVPRLILLGNEEEGLSPKRLEVCDELLMIPGSGAVQSLNVAQTAAILGWALQEAQAPKSPEAGSPRRRSFPSGGLEKGKGPLRAGSAHPPKPRGPANRAPKPK